jgi:hypothetical protein
VPIEIRCEDHRSLTEYAATAAGFEVLAAVGPLAAGRPPDPLPRRAVRPVFHKDYDAIAGNGPDGWHARFAVDRARFLAAYLRGRRAGGAVVITDPTDVEGLGGSPPFAILWDIRVAPDSRLGEVIRVPPGTYTFTGYFNGRLTGQASAPDTVILGP